MPSEASRALERELESFERLTADILSRFSYLPVDELPGAIEDTLRHVVETFDVDRSTVFELSDSGDTIEARYFWARPDAAPLRLPEAGARPGGPVGATVHRQSVGKEKL